MVCQEILRFSKYVLCEPESEDCVCVRACVRACVRVCVVLNAALGSHSRPDVSRSLGMWLRSLHVHSGWFLQVTHVPSYRT